MMRLSNVPPKGAGEVKRITKTDVFSITLDDAGVLVIATDEGVIELQPDHAKRLGHFMVGSERIWNPF